MYVDYDGKAADYDPALRDLFALFFAATFISIALSKEAGDIFLQELVDEGVSPVEILQASIYLNRDYSGDELIRNSPPNHPDFKPPKGGNRKVKNPNGNNKGWLAKDGGVWVWDRDMDGGRGWVVQYPNGNHEHKYYGGGSRSHNASLDVALIGIGVLATAVLIADNISGYGMVDDTLIPIIWTAIVA
jgi:hypothetical protein